jgi:type I restriction enzyme, S subunit
MKTRYPVIRLGEVIEEEREQVGTSDGNNLKVLGVTNTEGITSTGNTASEDKSKYIHLYPRRFVYNPYRINVGSIGLSKYDQEGIVSPAYIIFATKEQIDPDYLFFYMKSQGGNAQINFYGNRGTVRAALRFDDLCKLEIPFPPLSEQHRIVARIEELAAKIEEARGLRQEVGEEIKALIKSALRQTLSSNSGQLVPLESVCASITDNLHSNPVYSDQGIPCVRSPDVGWGKLYLDTALKTSEEEYIRRTVRGEPRLDDIVLVREGGGTGKAAIVEEGQRFSLGQRVMMLTPDKQVVVPKFLLYQILSPVIYEDQILPLSKGSASPHLNIGTLRNFRFLLPPLLEQHRIVTYLDGLLSKVDLLQQLQSETSAELDALLPSILDKAFKGEL